MTGHLMIACRIVGRGLADRSPRRLVGRPKLQEMGERGSRNALAAVGSLLAIHCWRTTSKQRRHHVHMAAASREMPSNQFSGSYVFAGKHEEKAVLSGYDYSKSTMENHTTKGPTPFVGKYAKLRASLDHTYHGYYTVERQLFQDEIIESLGNTVVVDSKTNKVCEKPKDPWLVFTAGAMGAGKSRAMKWLDETGHFPLASFVQVDPDVIRYQLPEMSGYLQRDMATAGIMTHREAGYIAEILTLRALQEGRNVLVDGSLRDADWYSRHIAKLREQHTGLKVAIIHIKASPEKVLARAAARALRTGRLVPMAILLDTISQVPRSIERLSALTDYCVCFNTDGDAPVLVTQGETLTSFKRMWFQECSDESFSTFNSKL